MWVINDNDNEPVKIKQSDEEPKTCEHINNICTDSRKIKGVARRRRRCKECGFKFTTIEIKVDDRANAESIFDEHIGKLNSKQIFALSLIEQAIAEIKEARR